MPSILILAGGVGERFWPVSTAANPKQFLPLTGSSPMILETINRVVPLVSPEKIYVVTTKTQLSLAYKILSDLPVQNIIVEPEGRNTAACLILSLSYIKKKEGKDEVIAVLPSDHFIGDDQKFQTSLASSFAAATEQNEIVTFGIKPRRPETGYGYIAVGPELASGVYQGLKFVEKPDSAAAERYIEDGGYLWNSGIFIFRINTLIEKLRSFSPSLYQGFLELEKAKNNKAIAEVYSKLPRTSIDYGLMEKVSSFLVIPASFEWDDLGTWRSLETIYLSDNNGNIVVGDAYMVDVKNSVIYAKSKLIVAVGVEDLIIVDGENATLICTKERLEEVKQIANKFSNTT